MRQAMSSRRTSTRAISRSGRKWLNLSLTLYAQFAARVRKKVKSVTRWDICPIGPLEPHGPRLQAICCVAILAKFASARTTQSDAPLRSGQRKDKRDDQIL